MLEECVNRQHVQCFTCEIKHVRCIEWRAQFSAGVCIRNVISLIIVLLRLNHLAAIENMFYIPGLPARWVKLLYTMCLELFYETFVLPTIVLLRVVCWCDAIEQLSASGNVMHCEIRISSENCHVWSMLHAVCKMDLTGYRGPSFLENIHNIIYICLFFHYRFSFNCSWSIIYAFSFCFRQRFESSGCSCAIDTFETWMKFEINFTLSNSHFNKLDFWFDWSNNLVDSKPTMAEQWITKNQEIKTTNQWHTSLYAFSMGISAFQWLNYYYYFSCVFTYLHFKWSIVEKNWVNDYFLL